MKRITIWIVVSTFTLLAGFGIGYGTSLLREPKHEEIESENNSSDLSLRDEYVLNYLSERPNLTGIKAPLENPAISRYSTSTYAYESLSGEQKGFYDKIYDVILSKQYEDYPLTTVCEEDLGLIACVDVSEFNLSGNSLFEAWLALLYDKPELYYVEGGALYSYVGDNEGYVLIHSVGKYKDYISRQIVDKEIDRAVSEIRERCEDLYGEEKAAEVGRYIAEKYEYASDAMDAPIVDTDTENISSLYFSKAVCGGYAKTYAFMAHQVGLESIFVTGYVDEGYHGWNYVRTEDGTWYGVDATFYDCGIDEYLLGGITEFSDHIPDSPGLSEDEYGACTYGHYLPVLSDVRYIPGLNVQDDDDTEEGIGTSEDNKEDSEVGENDTSEKVDSEYMPPNPKQTFYDIGIIREDGLSSADLYQIGMSFFENGDFINAIGYYQGALELSPYDTEVLKHIADSYYMLYDFADAAPYYKRLYELTGSRSDLLGYGYATYEGYGGSSPEAKEFDNYAKSLGWEIRFYIPDNKPEELKDFDYCTYFCCTPAGF